MPLTTHAIVEQDGGLVYALFQPIGIVSQGGMDTLVDAKILVADAWMKRRLGSNYNLPSDVNAQVMQAQAQSYLTLHYLTPILRACKTYGTNYPIWSEESVNYDSLLEHNWKDEASSLLDEWLTIERMEPTGFALPIFSTSQPIPTIDSEGSGLDSLDAQYEEALAFARGRVNANIGTASR